MDLMSLFLFLGGLVLLLGGAEVLVRGASRLAISLGISPLVVGLTVVALGTSSPELAVSIGSAMTGEGDAGLALGNVIGSNIFNVLFILGISAVVSPLVVNAQLIRQDVPVMIGLSILTFLLASDGALSRFDGVILAALFVVYVTFLILQSRRAQRSVVAEFAGDLPEASRGWKSTAFDLVLVAVGLVLLMVGARWLVETCTAFARAMGVSDVVIGLTVVAVGTSLPEIAASIMASLRGERDIAVGNVVGSNILNIVTVLGTTATLAGPLAIDESLLQFEFPVMVAVAVACLPIFFVGNRVSRVEGMLFLGYYIVYTFILLFRATSAAVLPLFETAVVTFVVPLTVLTVAIFVLRDVRQRRGEKNPTHQL